MQKKLTIAFIFFVLGVLPRMLYAQDAEIKARVNRTTIGLEDRLDYTVEISGKQTNLPDPEFPPLEAFAILSGPNTSSNIQWINGKMSAAKSYSFVLMPKDSGDFTIKPATVEINGQLISSNSIRIKVVKGSVRSTPKTQPANRNDAEITRENLFFRTEIDKRNVYQNEQILVTYKLYFRVRVRSYNIEKLPATSGFWTEEFAIPRQPEINTEIINGIEYQTAILRKVALFPTRSGELKIEPMVITVDAITQRQRRPRSLLDSFFDDPFGRTVRSTLASKPITLQIKPLPGNNQPDDFSGAVGNFQMSVSADKTELNANDAVSLVLTINGRGNIKLVKAPELKVPPDVELYEPKEKTDISRSNNRVSGNKKIEYILVPRYEGTYEIKPVQFSYFDPSAKSYKRLRSDPVVLNVRGGSATPGGLIAGSSLSKQEVALLGQDIRFIKETAVFYSVKEKLYLNIWYILAYLLPVGLVVAAWNHRRYLEKLRGDHRLVLRKRAGKLAARHLSAARKAAGGNDPKVFYKAVSLALQGFVADRLNIQLTDFNAGTVSKALEDRNVGNDEIAEYTDCLQESDFRQFSGSNADEKQMQAFYQKAKKILTRLEKYI